MLIVRRLYLNELKFTEKILKYNLKFERQRPTIKVTMGSAYEKLAGYMSSTFWGVWQRRTKYVAIFLKILEVQIVT